MRIEETRIFVSKNSAIQDDTSELSILTAQGQKVTGRIVTKVETTQLRLKRRDWGEPNSGNCSYLGVHILTIDSTIWRLKTPLGFVRCSTFRWNLLQSGGGHSLFVGILRTVLRQPESTFKGV